MAIPELRALIFDVDGTLADTEEAHRQAFNQTFEQAGLSWHWSQALYGELLAVAGGKERILHFIEREGARLSETLPQDLSDYVTTLHAKKTQRYQSMLQAGEVPLRSGAARLIKEAHEDGLQLAIATTTSLINVETLFDHAFESGVLGWFDFIAAGEMVTEKKPSPQVYHLALDGLALGPQQCFAFEDSLIGYQAATAAKLNTVITVDAYSRKRNFENPLIVLDQLGEHDQAFEVLKGDPLGHMFVDLEMVKALHLHVNSKEQNRA